MAKRMWATIAAGALAAAMLVLPVVPSAQAASVRTRPAAPVQGRAADPAPPPLQVTLVARQCAEYTDVTANRARNNIQESLRDLGADTLYAGGEPISVAKENQGQPNCIPIPDWTFTFGSGYSTGNPKNLSRVTGASGSATTLASTPELDQYGNDTGASLAGAVTVTLTPAQAALAAQPNKLWLMGGTPSSPPGSQLNGRADEFGFAALRCAIDDLNGDNVEWISYPQGASHVFCFAYYIQPPPESATIVVKKQTVDGNGDPLNLPVDLSFAFQGNVSYNDQPYQGAFTVDVPSAGTTGSKTFIRGAVDTGAGDTAWDFREVDPTGQGWVYVSATCQSSGGSEWTVDDVNFQVTVTKLVAGDTVTCTFKDRLPQTGSLALLKVTEGGAGGPFQFVVDTPGSGPGIQSDVTTTEPGVAEVVAEGSGMPTGAYAVSETLPADTAAGTWAFTDVLCEGVTPNVDVENRSFTATVADGDSALCVVVNTFTPLASITIKKVSIGGTLTADFLVSEIDPVSGDPGDFFFHRAPARHVPDLRVGRPRPRHARRRVAAHQRRLRFDRRRRRRGGHVDPGVPDRDLHLHRHARAVRHADGHEGGRG